jgi:hypothetical protein
MLVVCGFVFWRVRKKSWPVRLPLQMTSVVLGLSGVGGLWVMWWAVASSHVYSTPIYAPNQKKAVRIDSYNGGEIGGPTYDHVQLFSAHGFDSNVLFSGQWGSVEPSNLRWKSDSEMEIYYHGAAYFCRGTQEVTVHCIYSSSTQVFRRPSLVRTSSVRSIGRLEQLVKRQ